MHQSALDSFNEFKKVYLDKISKPKISLVEIGSLAVNSSVKNNLDNKIKYIGVDICEGDNVDIVLDDPYKFPFDDESIDAIISISTFEHTEFFWLTYLEILRVLKKDGLFFLNAPSNSKFHRHETDNWRFYPDSSIALEKWGKKNNFNPKVLEHYTNYEKGRDIWNDYVSVTLKDINFLNSFPDRIINHKKNFTNGRVDNSNKFLNYQETPQDQNNWGWKLYYKVRKFLNKL
jgi:SAM-dependent methyltransferase